MWRALYLLTLLLGVPGYCASVGCTVATAAAAPHRGAHAPVEKETDLQAFGKGWRYTRAGLPKEPPLHVLGGEWLGSSGTTAGSSTVDGEIFRPLPQGQLEIRNAEPGVGAFRAEKFRLAKAGGGITLITPAPSRPDVERLVCEAFWSEPLSSPVPAAPPKNEADLLKVKLVEIRGSVLVTIKGQKRRMFEGMDVGVDTVVKTAEGSSVVLVLGRGVSARLMSNTEVTVVSPSLKDKTPALNLQMKRGTVFQKVAPRLVPEAAKTEARAGRVLTDMGSVLCKSGDFAAVYEDGRFFAYILRGRMVMVEKAKGGAETQLEPRAASVPGMAAIPVVGEEVLTTVLLRTVAEAESFNTKVNALLNKLSRNESVQPAELEYLRRCPKMAVAVPVVSASGVARHPAGGSVAVTPPDPADGPPDASPQSRPGWQEATEAMGTWDLLR
ncbi:MAG: hypothetical protein ACAI35_19380 [Candidatus Methylacidiphilales bacterium]|nr:hypothetical protein [Candidatus Methylacidiphilales bacterium]